MSTVKPDETPPLILVTNDDGVHAPGLASLAEAAQTLGDVVVVAPDRNRSGVAHMITLLRPLRCREIRANWLACEGSPTDCVYLAVHEILPRRPRLLLSGVNAGPNLSYDVHYSGTFAAAVEGTLLGIPSIAVSLASMKDANFAAAGRFARMLGAHVLTNGLPSGITLNVNVPAGDPIGYQMTFLGHRHFMHSVDRRADPRGETYYWIGGRPALPRDLPGSDCNAVARGVVSVTPLSINPTDCGALEGAVGRLCLDGIERIEAELPRTGLRFDPEPYDE